MRLRLTKQLSLILFRRLGVMRTDFDAFLMTEVSAEAVDGNVYLQTTHQQNVLISRLSHAWIYLRQLGHWSPYNRTNQPDCVVS